MIILPFRQKTRKYITADIGLTPELKSAPLKTDNVALGRITVRNPVPA